MPALCNILVQGETGAPPVALGDVLKALYAIIATDAGSGNGTSELFASGGIHSLVSCNDVKPSPGLACRVKRGQSTFEIFDNGTTEMYT